MQRTVPVTKVTIGVALILVATIFAGNFLWIRVVVQALPPLVVQAVRFVVAGIALYAIAFARPHVARPTGTQWVRAALIGALLVAIGQGCISFAEQYVGAGLTVLVTCTIPLWVALLGALFFRERIGALALAGILVGFAGLLPIVLANGIGAKTAPAIVALVVSSLAWAIGSLATRRLNVHADGLVATAMQLLCGGAMLAIAVVATGGFHAAGTPSWTVAAGMLYLIVVGGIAGYAIYIWLLRNARPAVASTFTYLQAIVGVTFGAIILHEPVPPGVLAGGVAVVAGVACVVASRK